MPSSSSPPGSPPARSRSLRTPRRRLVLDRAARWVVSAGGLAIILAILGILLFILGEVWPLLARPRVSAAGELRVPGGRIGARIGAVLADEHRAAVAALTADGRVVALSNPDGQVLATFDALGPATPRPTLTDMGVPPQSNLLTGASSDGRAVIVPVSFDVTFSEQGKRAVVPRIGPAVVLAVDPAGRPLRRATAQLDEQGNATVAAELADGRLAVVRRGQQENLLTGGKTESLSRHEVTPPSPLSTLLVDHDQRKLYAGTAVGEILWWPLADGAPGAVGTASAGTSPITAMTTLIGGRSLVVGQADGSLSVWLQVRQSDDSFRLTRARDFPPHPGAVCALAPSPRNKGFLAADDHGRLGLYYSTSHRTLWTGAAPVAPVAAVYYTPKADGAFVAGGAGEDRIAALDVFNPHPEVSLGTLFGKVWYEGYDRPAYVWQSSGAGDDVEPKLSLTPLLAGTLKGTIYSLLLAIPLGVFGAMYASQFMHPAYKRYLKPLIEIMASLPSVVLGFLAGLWLAPRLEKALPGLILMAVVLPLVVLVTGFLWRLLPRPVRGRFAMGTEVLLFIVTLAGGIWLCLALSQPFEALAFGGSFQSWLLAATGLPFDQRNAVVVGLAMGFAVIPILFAIAEDAFSNVPANLVAGSLALGADRWQTVARVVLPTASPGIFSAIMIGFGRAIGETMIVLMATGNTPIIDWNPFNGFRTLSANIAVEIPEAPYGGTLYRTLFLAALLLFVITFLINTVAELVRQRLRERFSQL